MSELRNRWAVDRAYTAAVAALLRSGEEDARPSDFSEAAHAELLARWDETKDSAAALEYIKNLGLEPEKDFEQ